MEKTYYVLSDEVIGQIAKTLQVAILTGTDVVDHLRLMKLQDVGSTLHLTEEYKEYFEDTISSMLKKAPGTSFSPGKE